MLVKKWISFVRKCYLIMIKNSIFVMLTKKPYQNDKKITTIICVVFSLYFV